MCDLFQGSIHHILISRVITHMLRTSKVKNASKLSNVNGSLICHPWCSPLWLAMARPARNSIARWFWICETNPREMILILQAWWVWFDGAHWQWNWQIGKQERSVSMFVLSVHFYSSRVEVKGKCATTTWWRTCFCKGLHCAEFNQHQTEEANVSSQAQTPCPLLCNSDSSELVCRFDFLVCQCHVFDSWSHW